MRLTKVELDAILSAASQMEDDFEDYHSLEPKSYHKAFYSALDKLRKEASRREKLTTKADD